MKKEKRKNMSMKVRKSVQDTIPYLGVYKNGIIEIQEGYFTKSYRLTDVDFKTASEEMEDIIFEKFGDLLNATDSSMMIQFTINNKPIDKNDFKKQILCRLRGDDLDVLREESNQILTSKLKEGRSNMRHVKYMTICITADSIDDAISVFEETDDRVNDILKSICNEQTKSLTLIERLELLYNILNRGENDFYQRANIDDKERESFNFRWMKKQGLTSKDLICPSYIEFKNNYIKLDEKFARVIFLKNIPTRLSTDMLYDITSLPIDMITSLNVLPLEQSNALKLVRKQLTKTKKDVMDAQKNASKGGYSPELIPERTKEAYEDADAMLGEMTDEDQKLFLTNILIMHYADTEEDLDKDTKSIQTTAEKHICKFKPLNGLQELGFRDVLPLCFNGMMTTNGKGINKLLTTESTSVFLPFTTKEIMQSGGFYYGLNPVNRNMIIKNRKDDVNGNGVILGMPGTGKSFSAKREISNVALYTNDVIYIIDPQGEYSPLVKLLGGEEVMISVGGDKYLNPMDMDMQFADDGDPILLKSDFICSVCEIALGGIFGLTPIQKTIINRCVRLIYRDYMAYMMKLKAEGSHKTIDKSAMPTLQDLYEVLLAQDEPEARHIATALELYTNGSFDTFAHRTNVETNARIVSYNLAKIGENMRELGLSVCLNNLWNQIIENHKNGIRTWLYLDEFHLLANHDSSAEFTKKIYKMARKWGCIPTGITQNVGDLLLNEKAKAIISNCTFVYMLSQSPPDRDELAKIYNISDNQLKYITNGGFGEGLIYDGKNMIPFKDIFPSDTKLYKAMTTKPEDFEVNLA